MNRPHRYRYLPRIAVAATSFLALISAAVAQQAPLFGTLDGHTEYVYSIAYTPDGKSVVTAGFDGTVRVWDAATRKEQKKYEVGPSFVYALAPSPDGSMILTGENNKGLVKVWMRQTPGPIKELVNLPGGIHALATSPDGKQSAFASGKTVQFWDMQAASSKVLDGHAGDVESIAYRNDGMQVASGDKAKTIRLWNAADGAPQGVIETPADTVLGLSYHPNNSQLVSATSDGLVRLWQLPVIEPKVVEAKGPVKVFAVSLDGSKVATAGDDKMVRIWNAADAI